MFLRPYLLSRITKPQLDIAQIVQVTTALLVISRVEDNKFIPRHTSAKSHALLYVEIEQDAKCLEICGCFKIVLRNSYISALIIIVMNRN